LRAEIALAGGLCGRDRLGSCFGSSPDTVTARSLVPRILATLAVVQVACRKSISHVHHRTERSSEMTNVHLMV
jgi:hypothetical protein